MTEPLTNEQRNVLNEEALKFLTQSGPVGPLVVLTAPEAIQLCTDFVGFLRNGAGVDMKPPKKVKRSAGKGHFWGTRDAAKFLGIGHSTLAKMRSDGLGPKSEYNGRRYVYAEAEVRAWKRMAFKTKLPKLPKKVPLAKQTRVKVDKVRNLMHKQPDHPRTEIGKSPMGVHSTIRPGKAYISNQETAKLVGLAPSTLHAWRKKGDMPPHRIFGREVFYRRFNVMTWAKEKAAKIEDRKKYGRKT